MAKLSMILMFIGVATLLMATSTEAGTLRAVHLTPSQRIARAANPNSPTPPPGYVPEYLRHPHSDPTPPPGYVPEYLRPKN